MCSLRFPIDFPMGNPIIPYCWGEWMSINPSYFHVHQALDLQLYPVKQEFLRAHPIFFYFSWWISIPPHIFATPLPLTCSGACPDASALRGPGRRGGPPLALPMVADPISRSGPGGWDAYHRPYMIFSAHIVHTQIYIYIYHIILYIYIIYIILYIYYIYYIIYIYIYIYIVIQHHCIAQPRHEHETKRPVKRGLTKLHFQQHLWAQEGQFGTVGGRAFRASAEP